MQKLKVAALLALGVYFTWGAELTAATTNIVKIRSVVTRFEFNPTNIVIFIGDSIKWTNSDISTTHDTTYNTNFVGGTRVWGSVQLSNSVNNTFTFTFNTNGSYPYYCARHTSLGFTQTGLVSVVSFTRPTSGSAFFAPATVPLVVTASDIRNGVTNVQFFRGTTSLGNSIANPYSNFVSGLAVGAYGFTAVATDNQGARGTSSVVNVTVTEPPAIIQQSPALLADGAFHFTVFGGSAGQLCIIDAADAAFNWSPIWTTNFPNTTPVIEFTDTAKIPERRFYRARVFP
jgi:plastocyanin